MKLLNTLQTLVDKTKELEETVATQTSTIERLTSQLYLANKDNASDNDTKQNDITNATTWLANKRKFNNPTDNDVVDIKQNSDTDNLANDITTTTS